ncbi:hypothetical protein ACFL4C_03760 [Candidatus Omnitrophota bacterium]
MFGIVRRPKKQTHDSGFQLGFRLGFQMGHLEAVHKIWALAKAIDLDAEALRRAGEFFDRESEVLAEKQIQAILQKAEEEGKL